MRYFIVLSLLLVLLCRIRGTETKDVFDQGHISFTGSDSSISVDFVSRCPESSVEWRLRGSDAPAGADQSVKTDVQYLENVGFLHNAAMINLEKSSSYEYRAVCDGDDASNWVPFESPPYMRAGGVKVGVFADFGLTNGVSMDFIVGDDETDYSLHVGDFAYDLDSENSEIGNKFMRKIGERMQSAPYMPAVGNHEVHSTKVNGTEYVNRFRAVANHAGKASGSNSNFYYSFNEGLVHYVVVNTEIWRWAEEIEGSPLPHTAQEMLDWLEKDLERVDRTVTPWVVAMGHKAWYMSSFGSVGWRQKGEPPEVNWPALESKFCKGGVDLYLSGHVHLYQRFLPLVASDKMHIFAPPKDIDVESVSADGHTYTNSAYYPTIIVASPGDQEISPRAVCAGMDVVYHKSQAVCTAGYGYGHLTVTNATHMTWEFFQTGLAPNVNRTDPGEAVIFKEKQLRDTLHIVQEKHGLRDYC